MRKSLNALLAGIALSVTVFAKDNKPIQLTITQTGEVTKAGPIFGVEPNANLALLFTYTGENLGRSMSRDVASTGGSTWLKVTLCWLNEGGADIDDARSKLAFPPLKQAWELSDGSGKPVEVAVNLSVPGEARRARVDFTLLRDRPMVEGRAVVRDVRLELGQAEEKGIPKVVTGPPDAGPLNCAPEGVVFGENLVPNSALEEGGEAPRGWRIVGDNRGGAVRWITGGAYSGKHAFRIDDRGPYLRSWEQKAADPEVLVPGGNVSSNYGDAREEVYARWVSDPVPAEPGALYQTLSVIHYGNRHDPSRNLMNPVRIEFLDAGGKPITLDRWANGLADYAEVLNTPGWVPVVGQPVAAPRNARKVRLVVALLHAYYENMQGRLNKNALNPGFVVVDNIALYKVTTERPKNDLELTRVSRDRAFADTLAASGIPFVPTSPAHRPNSLAAESQTPIGAGILLKGHSDTLGLEVCDKIGDRRELTLTFRLLDARGESIHEGKVSGTVEPYREVIIPLAAPANLPLGPYTVDYKLIEKGKTTQTGETRLAVVVEHPADLTERKRMDYPFGTWAHRFKQFFFNGHEREFDWLGKTCQFMGSGKQGFVISFYPELYLGIADDTVRRARIAADIARNRQLFEAMAGYDVFNLLLLHPVPPLTDETRPRAVELVKLLVDGLADLSLVWTYGDEQIHGGIEVGQLDETRNADGSLIMYWGYPGSARKYIQDYVLLYDAMKAAQPEAIFGFNSASHANGNVMRLLMAAGANGKFDMFGCNMFMSPFSLWPATIDVMKQNGVDPNGIWLFGHNFDGLVRANPATIAPGLPRIETERADALYQLKYWTRTLYAFPQLTFVPQWDPGLLNDGKNLTYNQRVTPAFSSYAAMTRFLGAGKFVAKREFPGAEVYVRERSARPGLVGVGWATGDTPATVELAVGAPTVTVADVWGNQRPVAAPEGVLTLELTDSPQYILEARKLEPAPAVRIEISQASVRADRPQFRVTLHNDMAKAVAGELALDVRAAATVAPTTISVDPIPSGESRSYLVDIAPFAPTDDRPLPIMARFTIAANGRVYEATQPLNFHFAPQASVRPTVDGLLDDWSLDDRLALVADREEQLFKYQNKGPWSGPEELSGKLWMQWDMENLYLAAIVRDAGEMIADNPGQLWAGDSIEMLIAPEGGRASDSKFTQIAMGRIKSGGATIMRYQGAGGSGPLKNAPISVRRVNGGYMYEAAVPWSALTENVGFAPRAGHAISAVFGFNDKDAGTRMISWFNRVTYKDPTSFGQIVLTGPITGWKKSSTPKNLVPNGDFEDVTLPPSDDLKNWRTTFLPDKMGNPSAKAYLSRDGAYHGKSLIIERLHNQNHAEVGGFRIPVEPGRRYLIRAMIKAPVRQPSLQFGFITRSNTPIKDPLEVTVLSESTYFRFNGMLMMNTDRVTDRDHFHLVTAVVTAPDDAVTMHLGFNYNWASGKAYFDNVEVFELAKPRSAQDKEWSMK
jgi:hypothetical protein